MTTTTKMTVILNGEIVGEYPGRWAAEKHARDLHTKGHRVEVQLTGRVTESWIGYTTRVRINPTTLASY